MIYRVALLSLNCDFCLWRLNLIKIRLARNNNFLKCWGLCSSEELCGEQAILASKSVFVNLERLLGKPVSGPNIWLLLITFCPCFIPSHLLLLGPEFSPNCQGWMISKIRLSLFPWCQGPGHWQVSFPLERWKKQRSLSLPPSSSVAKLFSPVSPAGNLSLGERGRKRGWLLTCIRACVFSHVRFFGTPWTLAHQAPLSMGFSRQEYWSGLPCPPPGDLPDPGIQPASPASQADSLPTEPPWEAWLLTCVLLNHNSTSSQMGTPAEWDVWEGYSR